MNNENLNKFGLSKKTNIAIAGVAGISVAADSTNAVIALSVIVIVALTYQFILDFKTERKST